MRAAVGDRLVIRGHVVGQAERHATVIDVRGKDGAPPYVVEWSDGHTGLIHTLWVNLVEKSFPLSVLFPQLIQKFRFIHTCLQGFCSF